MDYSKFLKKISTKGLTPKEIEEYCNAVVLGELETAQKLGTKPNQELVVAAMGVILHAQDMQAQKTKETKNGQDYKAIKGGFHM